MKPTLLLLPLLVLLSYLAGCAHRPTATYQPPATATTVPGAARLLFLSCRLTAAAAGTQLEVLEAKAVAGALKAPEADADTPEFVRVLQLDGRGQVLSQLRVAHPLRRSVEHVADDHRTFQRSEVVLPTAEFFVRLALRPTTAAIRLEEVVAGATTPLSEFPIPPKS